MFHIFFGNRAATTGTVKEASCGIILKVLTSNQSQGIFGGFSSQSFKINQTDVGQRICYPQTPLTFKLNNSNESYRTRSVSNDMRLQLNSLNDIYRIRTGESAQTLQLKNTGSAKVISYGLISSILQILQTVDANRITDTGEIFFGSANATLVINTTSEAYIIKKGNISGEFKLNGACSSTRLRTGSLIETLELRNSSGAYMRGAGVSSQVFKINGGFSPYRKAGLDSDLTLQIIEGTSVGKIVNGSVLESLVIRSNPVGANKILTGFTNQTLQLNESIVPYRIKRAESNQTIQLSTNSTCRVIYSGILDGIRFQIITIANGEFPAGQGIYILFDTEINTGWQSDAGISTYITEDCDIATSQIFEVEIL